MQVSSHKYTKKDYMIFRIKANDGDTINTIKIRESEAGELQKRLTDEIEEGWPEGCLAKNITIGNTVITIFKEELAQDKF